MILPFLHLPYLLPIPLPRSLLFYFHLHPPFFFLFTSLFFLTFVSPTLTLFSTHLLCILLFLSFPSLCQSSLYLSLRFLLTVPLLLACCIIQMWIFRFFPSFYQLEISIGGQWMGSLCLAVILICCQTHEWSLFRMMEWGWWDWERQMKGKSCQGSGSQRTSCLYLSPPDACFLACLPSKQVNCITLNAPGRRVCMYRRRWGYRTFI